MSFPSVTAEDWRRLVEKELAGKPFDKALVQDVLPGVAIAPLYTEAPEVPAAARVLRQAPFAIGLRHGRDAVLEDLARDVAGGADVLWLPLERAHGDLLAHEPLAPARFLLEASSVPSADEARRLATDARVSVAIDPLSWRATGESPHETLAADLQALATIAPLLAGEGRRPVVVSTAAYHDAGADAADELGIALASAVTYLEALLDAGIGLSDAANAIAFRPVVGRDTFVELCKLRALRICWAKVVRAFGADADATTSVHAVCSSQTMALRDPWVNMLRVTTQMFAGILGGAELVTPRSFDEAFGETSPMGQRLARNTGLVLREESALGKVSDPAGGSYFFDSLTDALARTGWSRFQELSGEGIAALLSSGRLEQRLAKAWTTRLARLGARRIPTLGVSEFANLSETLPHPLPGEAPTVAGLPAHRDTEPFEELRRRADALGVPPTIALVTLGAFAESRARAGFASTFFAAGGVRSQEVAPDAVDLPSRVACICGTDERYATDAAACVVDLKRRGVAHVILAGKPGALEAPLREAGLDGAIFVGCDAVATLSDVLEAFTRASASSENPS